MQKVIVPTNRSAYRNRISNQDNRNMTFFYTISRSPNKSGKNNKSYVGDFRLLCMLFQVLSEKEEFTELSKKQSLST